jgi:hypothetical protein
LTILKFRVEILLEEGHGIIATIFLKFLISPFHWDFFAHRIFLFEMNSSSLCKMVVIGSKDATIARNVWCKWGLRKWMGDLLLILMDKILSIQRVRNFLAHLSCIFIFVNRLSRVYLLNLWALNELLLKLLLLNNLALHKSLILLLLFNNLMLSLLFYLWIQCVIIEFRLTHPIKIRNFISFMYSISDFLRKLIETINIKWLW